VDAVEGGRFGPPQQNNGSTVTSMMKFKGRCKDLELYVYDYLTPSQAAKDYKTTTKEIGEYVGRTYEKGIEVQRIIEDGAITALAEPADLTSEEQKSEVKKAIWKKQVEAHVKRLEKRDDNVCKAYMLVFGQCSEVVRSKLEAMSGYATMQSKYDLVELLLAAIINSDGDVLLSRSAEQDACAD
jgi:hypothetical protein